MARHPAFEHLYQAFNTFLQRCIFDDRSLILPERHVWTPENVTEVKRRLIESPQIGAGNFLDKLSVQMARADPDHWVLLADVHYVYYLPANSIKLATKTRNIQWCLEQGNAIPPPGGAEIWRPLETGFVHVTQRYNLRYLQLWLILLWVDHLKHQATPSSFIDDHRCMQRLLDELLEAIPARVDRAYDMRHALLYLAHPDKYEPSISTRDKERIVATYRGRLVEVVPDDLDEAIYRIRQVLAPVHDKSDRHFDFYTDLRGEWGSGTAAQPSGSESDSPLSDDLPPAAALALKMLKRTRNVILYGPPGTGKTYIAQKVADSLMAEQSGGLAAGQAFVERVTFHQSYAYEDFVEGWRPVQTAGKGGIVYEVRPGVLRRIAERAEHNPNSVYVLFIDEINRGNVVKIFGELITLLEDDKRKGQPNQLTVTLPYSGDAFTLPANLYVIATMNTADRSIALLDVALRRRFAFVEIMPNSELLREVEVASETHSVNLGQLLDSLNRYMSRSLDRDHQIGHSYFLRVGRKQGSDRIDELEYVWNGQIMPLLEEYFYSQRDVLARLLSAFVSPNDSGDEEDRGVEFDRLSGEDLIYALSTLK